MDGSDASLIGEEGRGPRESLLIGYLSSFFSDYNFGNDFVRANVLQLQISKTHQREIYKLFINQNRPIRRCLKIYFALCNPFSNTINVFYLVERIKKFAIIFNSSNVGVVFSASHHNYYEHYGLIEYRINA